MLKFFKALFRKNSAATTASTRRATLNSRRLCQMIPFFPLGSSIKYYPEYRQEVVLDSIIIAYQINNQIIYSSSDIVCSADGREIILNGAPLEAIYSFALLIPSEGRGENELDYARKELLGKNGGFIKGNTLTLIGEQKEGKIPAIDTIVRKYMRLKEGYYNDLQVVVLNIDPTLLTLKDQRSQMRLKAKIPGTIQTAQQSDHDGTPSGYACTIIDFAEHITKVTVDDPDAVSAKFSEGGTVTLSFDLPASSEANIMRGVILRTDENSMVVRLEDVFRAGAFEKLMPIDLIEIKARLLQLQSE